MKEFEGPLLVSRVTWMDTYATPKEAAVSGHGWVQSGNTPGECLNFRENEDGRFLGYVQIRGDSGNKPGRLGIENLGASKTDDCVENTVVVFAARSPDLGKTLVVGCYLEATVHRNAQYQDVSREDFVGWPHDRIWRIESKTAHCLPPNERIFELPTGKNGIGQADLWYGLANPKSAEAEELRGRLLAYLDQEVIDDAEAPTPDFEEARVLAAHRRIERRSDARKIVYERGFVCEACDFSVTVGNESIWNASIEVHHLVPMRSLKVGHRRIIRSEDLAVLCANCHRAIHKMPDPSDLGTFKEKWFSGDR